MKQVRINLAGTHRLVRAIAPRDSTSLLSSIGRGCRSATYFLILLFALSVFGSADTALLPQPEKSERHDGSFELTSKTKILVDATSQITGEQLAQRLRTATGFRFPVERIAATQANDAIILSTGAARLNNPESYELTVSSSSVTIRAAELPGLFYGTQTLLQLLPPEIHSPGVVAGVKWQLPCLRIEDQPRFKWRGLMLDVSRHFFTKDEVKRLLDLMAVHKLNTFHWHLVDDQGWRVEIKKYPKLTSVGAWRTNASLVRPHHGQPPVTAHPKWAEPTAFASDGRYGGFYTQEDIREVVAYAAALHITVIPEIELPGHSVAALQAYPEFSCFGGPFDVDVGAGVHRGIYCAGNDKAFAFLEDILSEVIPLFPAKYIHIGGDEVQKDTWRKCPKCQARIKAEGLHSEEGLQSYFIRRMENFISRQGKTIVGWSEIREGGLAQNAVVMDWIGGGREAAEAGHDVVMTPQSHCYFDHYQALDQSLEPRAICCYLPLKKVYAFEPVPAGLSSDKAKHILGAQANLWTEYIASAPHLDYMIFPRLNAMAEVLWSPKAARNEADFFRRLAVHEMRLEKLGVNFRRDRSVLVGEWKLSMISTQLNTVDWNVTEQLAGAGEYHVTFEYSRGAHALKIDSVALLENGAEIARETHAGFSGSEHRNPVYVLKVPARKPGATYLLQARVAGEGGTDSSGAVSWVISPKAKGGKE